VIRGVASSGRDGGLAAGITVPTSRGDAVVVLDRTAEPAFLLALTHGAGGGVDAPDLLAVRDAALALGGTVARVIQAYHVRGGRAPGSAARQDESWIEVMAALPALADDPHTRPAHPAVPDGRRGSRVRPGCGLPLIQGGRSNGARLACRTAAATGADAVIALAFPVHPPGHPERSRRGELLAAGVDVLAVSGSRDPFGIPDAADVARLIVLSGESHTLAKNPAAVRTAVLDWLAPRMSRGR
jgi:uncharacterized protein